MCLALFSCPMTIGKGVFSQSFSNQLPCSEAHFACHLLRISQHTRRLLIYLLRFKEQSDFQVSPSRYLCSKLSYCICINFLFPKVNSMYSRQHGFFFTFSRELVFLMSCEDNITQWIFGRNTQK